MLLFDVGPVIILQMATKGIELQENDLNLKDNREMIKVCRQRKKVNDNGQ